RDGTLVGTASYLAPEQLTNSAVDGRADLYSLGLVLYECLTGRVPFEGDTGAAVALARLHTSPVDPRRVRSDIPAHLANAIMRSLRRDPDERFDSAAAFRAALVRPDLPVPAPAVEPPPPEATEVAAVEPPTFGRSERRWLMPAFVILLFAVAVIVAGMLLRDSRAPTTTTTTTTIPPGRIAVRTTTSYDPQGSGTPGENESLAGRATDGDERTAWRTESYDQADFFGPKHGVGLVVELADRSRLDSLQIDGSTNGWSGEIFVLDGPPDAAGIGDLTPAARVSDVRARTDVDLHGATGTTVLLWITNLGDVADGGRHRVEISELVPFGVKAVG
ncbi:MAG: hypothetical protein JST64_00275, partial [Actinobacteria bacterium]|nr:hypothetical protein [Actinomycetota bacterium]